MFLLTRITDLLFSEYPAIRITLWRHFNIFDCTAMRTIVLNSQPLAADNKKPRRYILCLEMAETILKDFFPLSENKPGLFQHLGKIAYCIDTHLDEMHIEQKERLLKLFPSFFDTLGQTPDEITFHQKLNSFCHELGTNICTDSAISTLYPFYTYCMKHRIGAELKEFSMTVIRSAILKSRTDKATDVLKSIKEEGAACVHFLLLMMEKEKLVCSRHRKFISLKGYLQRLETMLNLADAIYDYKKDKKNGVLGLHVGKNFHCLLSVSFSKAFFSTIIKNHFFFLKHFVVFTGRCFRANIF